MRWLLRNAPAVEATAAVATVIVAVAALIGVKFQLDAADAVQKAQSARDAYRSHLALGTSHPAYAAPADACELLSGPEAGAYSAFVDHLLYSAEQMLDVEPGWDTTFSDALEPHSTYVCGEDDLRGSTEKMRLFLSEFKNTHCDPSVQCD